MEYLSSPGGTWEMSVLFSPFLSLCWEWFAFYQQWNERRSGPIARRLEASWGSVYRRLRQASENQLGRSWGCLLRMTFIFADNSANCSESPCQVEFAA